MFSSGTHPQDRLFIPMMVGTSIIGSAVVIVALYVLTASLDRHASESGNKEVSLILHEWMNSLTNAVEDYAIEDVTYQKVTDRDDEAAMSSLGVELGDDGLVDWIAILDADANLLFDLNLPAEWDSASFFGDQKYLAILNEVGLSNPTELPSIAGAFEREGIHFLAATTRMTPYDLSGVRIETLPFIIGGRNLDASALEEIAIRTGSSNVSISSSASERSVPLEGPLGSKSFLAWEAELPGLRFRQNALPWVVLICGVFVFLTGWMASYFRRLATSLGKMRKVATTDQLTGIANRAALMEILETSSVKDAFKNGVCAVISIDLNDFKRLNDEHGHRAGDMALKVAAKRIRRSLHQEDEVIRMGGDEFVCLVFDPNPTDAAQTIADRIKLAFKAPMNLGECSQIVAPSIGIAISNGNDTWDNMLERSDAEMYRAKRASIEPKLCVS